MDQEKKNISKKDKFISRLVIFSFVLFIIYLTYTILLSAYGLGYFQGVIDGVALNCSMM